MVKKAEETLGPKKENVKWTTRMDELLIEAMLHEHAQGNRPDSNFTSQAYRNMVTFLVEELNMPHLTKSHLINRMKTLKGHFTECYDLFKSGRYSSSGFSWNSIIKLWEAEDAVWADLIETHPKANGWRNKKCLHCNKLEELLAKDRATGEGAITAKEKRKKWANMTRNPTTSTGTGGEAHSQVPAESVNLYDDNEFNEFMIPPSEVATPSQVPVESVCTSKVKYKKAKYSNDGEDKLANVVNKLTTILEKQGEAFINSLLHVYYGNEIFDGLKEMNLEEENIDDAYLWLLENQDKAKAVFGMPLEKKLSFLKNMMNARNNHG